MIGEFQDIDVLRVQVFERLRSLACMYVRACGKSDKRDVSAASHQQNHPSAWSNTKPVQISHEYGHTCTAFEIIERDIIRIAANEKAVVARVDVH